ncbi:MAG: beta-propeller fold lactonase family protein [Planctomycetaceae bacterium]|jgi:YVTN family beta-propeller protein|nr:beta-propeller fold lactonase family protein [Planctomycetaceae bacterium]
MNNRFFILFVSVFLFGITITTIPGHIVLAADNYKSPLDLAATKDGSKIYIALFDAHEIAVLDTAQNKIVQTIPVGKEPTGIVLSTDEKTIYVTSGSYRGLVQAVDVVTGKVVREVDAGHTPTAPAVTPDGKKMFVCNRFNNNVSEYDLPELKLVRRINVIREPRGAVVTKDGKTVYVANALPNNVANIPENHEALINVASEVSAIDIATGTTKNIRFPNGSGSIRGICISPDGRYVYLAGILSRFQHPTTQLERGWMNTNTVSIIDTTQIDNKRSGFVNTVLIDDVDLGAANPWGITTSADGKQLFVALSGTSELIIIDAEAMHKKLSLLSQENQENQNNRNNSETENNDSVAKSNAKRHSASTKASDVPNDLAFLVGLKKRVRLNGKGARPIVVIGNNVYVGMYYSDTLQKVDLTVSDNSDVTKNVVGNKPTSPTATVSLNNNATEIMLGGKPNLTKERLGEIHWNDATLSFQHWQSCASCHPDGRMDAYNWDLLDDGLGNPKNTKSLLWSDRSPPVLWEGVRETSARCTRTKFQYILFSMPDEAQCLDIDAYVHAMQPVPSPYLVDGKLSERAERGKKIFEDTKISCVQCHPAPLFTDQKLHDVNTKCFYDRKSSFDTPTLIETWRTAPYLHDGRYINMKDLFKKGKHGDTEGDIDSLTDEQLNDLIEYVLSL